MPLYQLCCPECGAAAEEFCHVAEDRGARTHACACGGIFAPTLSLGVGLTYFEEGKGRWIHNLSHEPVYVTSPHAHRRAMQQAGVEWATRGRGEKGSWV